MAGVCKFGIGQLEIFKKILAWIITSNCECICYEKNVWVTLQEWIYCELLGCIYCIISYSELLIMFLCNKFVCGFLDWVKYVIMLLSMVSYSNSCVFTMYKVISIECLLCTQWVRLLECVYYEISYCDLLVCVLYVISELLKNVLYELPECAYYAISYCDLLMCVRSVISELFSYYCELSDWIYSAIKFCELLYFVFCIRWV